MQTLLTAEDLRKNFDLGEEEHSQITGSTFLFNTCALQLYHTIQIFTFLTRIRIVMIACASQVKKQLFDLASLSQLNMS